MKIGFSESAAQFQSASQSARVDTEAWAYRYMFCPNCGNKRLAQFPANKPVADFFCDSCGDEYELKSQSKRFGRRVVDGAYDAKIARLLSDTSPNLILMQYDRNLRTVQNLTIIPKFFFTRSVIEKRKPLSTNARRAGWVGSNILLDRIPASGRIPIICGGEVRRKATVIQDWNKLRFVEKRVGLSRGWLLEVMQCIESLQKSEFFIDEVYAFERHLEYIYPNNNNIRPKMRQQLQVLRDAGFLEFLGRGRYRLVRRA